MSEWLAPGLVLLSFAAFSVVVAYLAFSKGVEMGKQMPQFKTLVSRVGRTAAISVPRDPVLDPLRKCVECGNPANAAHHPDCPLEPSKNRPRSGRRWKGFSAQKRDLENKESA